MGVRRQLRSCVADAAAAGLPEDVEFPLPPLPVRARTIRALAARAQPRASSRQLESVAVGCRAQLHGPSGRSPLSRARRGQIASPDARRQPALPAAPRCRPAPAGERPARAREVRNRAHRRPVFVDIALRSRLTGDAAASGIRIRSRLAICFHRRLGIARDRPACARLRWAVLGEHAANLCAELRSSLKWIHGSFSELRSHSRRGAPVVVALARSATRTGRWSSPFPSRELNVDVRHAHPSFGADTTTPFPGHHCRRNRVVQRKRMLPSGRWAGPSGRSARTRRPGSACS